MRGINGERPIFNIRSNLSGNDLFRLPRCILAWLSKVPAARVVDEDEAEDLEAPDKSARREGTEVNTTQWHRRVSDTEMRRRVGGRRRYNSVRTLLKTLRRQQVLELLAAWGFGYGVQARIAATLNVHPSVVSRDSAALTPFVESCPTCGSCVPRRRAVR